MTELYYADVGPLAQESAFSAGYRAMPVYRRKKIDSFRFPADKRLSLGVGLLLQTVLAERGLSDRDVVCTPEGKPELPGSGVFFNLSHSGERVLCAVSDTAVGCDVQKIEGIHAGVAERFFSPEENARIAAGNGEAERAEIFSRIWALRESWMKMTGCGFGGAPEGLRLTWRGGAPAVTLGEQLLPCGLTVYRPEQDYVCALCTVAPEAFPPVLTEKSLILF